MITITRQDLSNAFFKLLDSEKLAPLFKNAAFVLFLPVLNFELEHILFKDEEGEE